MGRVFVIPIFLICCMLFGFSDAKIIRHTFNVSYFPGSPDGVYTEMILGINGQFPGPTIYADIGDILEIHVINSIQHGGQNTSIHWHGIHQKDSIFEDGTSQITQCPLKNGEQQRYTVRLHQSGTFWYHSHVHSQYTEGLWGILIVRNLPEVHPYDEEIIITLSDWYHQTAKDTEEWLMSGSGGGAHPIPNSGLINGIGRYHCGFAIRQRRFCDPDAQMRPVFPVQRNKTVKVRVISTSAYASFNFSIDGHTLETIEVDSTDVATPVSADIVKIGSGQRYSFLIRTNGSLDRYLIRAHLRMELFVRHPVAGNINLYREANMANMTAVLLYTDSPVIKEGDDMSKPTYMVEPHSYLDEDPLMETDGKILLDESLLTPFDGHTAPSYFDQEIVLEAGFYNHHDGLRRPAFNATPFFLPEGKPLMWTILEGDPIPPLVFPIEIDYMQVVQIVINNPFWNPHPLHLHGHDFWVVSQGKWWDGNYDPAKHDLTLTGARRDTIFIEEQSYIVIRFVADNPGAWTFHCHIDWHNLSGMALVFIEAKDMIIQRTNVTDEAKRVCDLWK